MRRIAVAFVLAICGALSAGSFQPIRAQDLDGPVPPQGAVLYEEDKTSTGLRFDGQVAWRTEPDGPLGELSIQGSVAIPDRQVALTLTLRRNHDSPDGAGQLVEIVFSLPPGYHGGGVRTVAGIVMRSDPQTGKGLIGRAEKTGDGLFRVVLSGVAGEQATNLQLLRDLPLFHIPIIYADGSRAVVALSKGATGEDVFARAMATWN